MSNQARRRVGIMQRGHYEHRLERVLSAKKLMRLPYVLSAPLYWRIRGAENNIRLGRTWSFWNFCFWLQLKIATFSSCSHFRVPNVYFLWDTGQGPWRTPGSWRPIVNSFENPKPEAGYCWIAKTLVRDRNHEGVPFSSWVFILCLSFEHRTDKMDDTSKVCEP